jgi:hypothetical protein
MQIKVHSAGQTVCHDELVACVHTRRQTDRQTERQTDRQPASQTDRQTDRKTVRQAGRQADGRADRDRVSALTLSGSKRGVVVVVATGLIAQTLKFAPFRKVDCAGKRLGKVDIPAPIDKSLCTDDCKLSGNGKETHSEE